ncbi:unnamed protein product [Spirodela intermedia]|uniref:BHLH domain-containing protein n=1 Tax=Spirodela intermedia TaxID=51605 RepID=A0A7I8KQR8_SPIIN|nr:unnamed protein product [Spirodela intermedia]
MKGRQDSQPPKMASCSPASSPLMTDREFVKLLWESAGRPRKGGPYSSSLPFFSGKDQGREVPEHPMATRAAARPAAAEDSPASHAPPFGPLQDDELVAWLSCPIDDYCSELLSDISGADVVSSTEAAAPAAASSRAPAGPMEAGRMSSLKELPKKEAAAPKPVLNFSIFSRPLMESSSLIKPAAVMKANSEVLPAPETASEPAIVSSSLCSQNGARKRRREEDDEIEDQTDHGEDESTDRRRPADKGQAVNKKRSRSAEIHNLSERRRRDRINEKMRALQALVPSCNKVDRASMLDEVIEYLKSLQMQVQAMSMGRGMFVRPMMLPNGMGMNMNMGMMGMGTGMGMIDMPSFPMMSFSPMHGHPHGPSGIQMMMPGSNGPRMVGIMPGQVVPMSMFHTPHFIPVRPPPPPPSPPPPPPLPPPGSSLQGSDLCPPNVDQHRTPELSEERDRNQDRRNESTSHEFFQ